MNSDADLRRTGTLVDTADAPSSVDVASMDRDALAKLVAALFRWALRHTGLTRQQIMERIRQEEGGPL
jgi:hypothetical protein